MAAKTKQEKEMLEFINSTLTRLRTNKAFCFIYNMNDEQRRNIVKKIEDNKNEIVISAINYSNRHQLISALGKASGCGGKDPVQKKLNKFYEDQESFKMNIVINNAEMLQSVGLKFLEEIYQMGTSIVFISSHPRFKSLFSFWDLYSANTVIQIDYKN